MNAIPDWVPGAVQKVTEEPPVFVPLDPDNPNAGFQLEWHRDGYDIEIEIRQYHKKAIDGSYEWIEASLFIADSNSGEEWISD